MEERVPAGPREQSLSSGAFRNTGLLLGYFHQLWFDTSDALSVPGPLPGTFLNLHSGFKLRPGCAPSQRTHEHARRVKGLLFSCSFSFLLLQLLTIPARSAAL